LVRLDFGEIFLWAHNIFSTFGGEFTYNAIFLGRYFGRAATFSGIFGKDMVGTLAIKILVSKKKFFYQN